MYESHAETVAVLEEFGEKVKLSAALMQFTHGVIVPVDATRSLTAGRPVGEEMVILLIYASCETKPP